MFIPYKAPLIVFCAVALALVAWRLILPLAVMHVAGVGVEVPLPKGFVKAHPRLATYVFVLGGPSLFLGLIIALVWLLRLR